MDLVNRDKNSGMEAPPVWAEYQAIIDQAEARRCEMTKIERLVSETNSSSAYDEWCKRAERNMKAGDTTAISGRQRGYATFFI